MNKKDLVRHMAHSADIPLARASLALEGFIEKISECIKEDEPVLIKGFLSITTIVKPARTMYSALVKKEINVPERKSIKIKPGATLKKNL